MKKLNLFLFIFVALSVVFTSCDENDDSTNPTNYNEQQSLAQNYAFAQSVYSDIFDFLCQASTDSTLMASGSATIAGAAVTYNAVTNTFVFTFPAKTTNTSAGSFTAVLDGNFKEEGTVAHITFDNYTVNGNSVTGSNDVINTGRSGKKTTGPTIFYTDSVYNATIVKNGETINVTALYHIDWMLGDTTTTADDQYLFSGTITGTVNPNKWFTAVVNSSNKVLVTTACQYIQSGIIDAVTHTLDANNQPKQTNVTIDFISSDGCSDLVQINMNGTIVTFHM